MSIATTPIETPKSPKSTEPQVRKRKKVSTVCTNCRKRKIRCDRQHPCNNCIKSKKHNACVYDDGQVSPANFLTNGSSHGNTVPESRPYEESARIPIRFDAEAPRKKLKPNTPNNERKNSKKSPDNTVANNQQTASENEVTITLSELNMLKQRLQNIEANINAQSNPQSNPPYVPQTPAYPTQPNILPPPVLFNSWSPKQSNERVMFSPQQRLTTNYNVSHTRGQSPSIQLPPLSFKDTPRASIDSAPLYSEMSPPRSDLIASSLTSPESIQMSVSGDVVGVNPYLNETETINFYDGYTSICVRDFRRVNHGPFAWSSLMRKDKALSSLWNHILKKKEKKNVASQTFVFGQDVHEISQENTQLVASESNESETKFKKKTLETFGFNDVVPYDILKKKLQTQINKTTLPLGLTLYEEQVNMELQLVDRIHQQLPKKKVLWKLIDRFFSLLYPFMPFLDEIDFRESVTKIIGETEYKDEKIKELKVEKRLDLAVIGVLLIILRMSYLSLFCNKESVNEMRLKTTDPSPEAQDMKYLLQNPIGISLIDSAQNCLQYFDIFRKTSMPVLQCAYFLQLYHIFAPEDGDDGDGADTYALNSMVVRMAYSMGLNREPDNFKDVLNDKRQNHLGRKIWHFLVIGDVHNSYAFGTPKLIGDDFYDTKVPFIEEGNENLIDKSLDQYVTKLVFPGYFLIYNSVDQILKLILSVSRRLKVSEICKILNQFEIGIAEQYGTLSDCLKPKENLIHIFARNMPVKMYISLKSFLVSVYFHLFLYYEHKNDSLSFFYLRKILKTGAGDIMPHYFELLGNSEVVCDMVINPKLIQIIHKANQINIALIIRVNMSIYRMKNLQHHAENCKKDDFYYSYYKELCKFSSCLTRCAEVGIAAVSKLSTRYYYAWKITKGHNFLLKTITSMEFYEKESTNAQEITLPKYKLEQIADLENICEVALNKLGKTLVMGDEFCSNVNYKKYKGDQTYSTSSESSSTPNKDSPLDSRKYTNDFGLDLVNNQEIDKIWLQMLSLKSEEAQQQRQQELQPFTSSQSQSQSPLTLANQGYMPRPELRRGSYYGNTPFALENLNFDGFGGQSKSSNNGEADLSSFDFFVDLPFDQLFTN